MGDLIIYATKKDSDAIRIWINNDPDIAWIVKVAEGADDTCHWKAVNSIDVLHEQGYARWHINSGPLNIPSGDRDVADAIVADPFAGRFQTMQQSGATSPWFGANLPGPYYFRFAESGREAPGVLADQTSFGMKTTTKLLESWRSQTQSAGGRNCSDTLTSPLFEYLGQPLPTGSE